jgi:hypothetical protein
MKILISDTDSGHSDLVEQAFLAGYNAYGTFAGTIEKRIEDLSVSLSYAQANSFEIVIRSITGMSSSITLALTRYPGVQVIMPAGSNNFQQIYNSGGNLPNIIVTGAGDTENETGYDIEFFAPDIITTEPDLSSFSNAYIAGQLAYIADTLTVNLWTARYLARIAGNEWTAENGYGLINVAEAIAAYDTEINYNSLDPYIPRIGTTPVLNSSKISTDINLFFSVSNAALYEIWKAVNSDNFTLLEETAETSYTDEVLSSGTYKYKVRGKFDNAYGEEEISDYSTVAEIKQMIQREILLNV